MFLKQDFVILTKIEFFVRINPINKICYVNKVNTLNPYPKIKIKIKNSNIE